MREISRGRAIRGKREGLRRRRLIGRTDFCIFFVP
jgi:hypothetical protein